jgi:hypothetical protein
MKYLEESYFLKLLSGHSIGKHPQYNSSDCHFLPMNNYGRFWCYPKNPDEYYSFLKSLFNSLPSKACGWLYPPAGVWNGDLSISIELQETRRILLKSISLEARICGALYFDRYDYEGLLKAIYNEMCDSSDIFFISEISSHILFFQHHSIVIVKCRTEKDLLELIEKLSNEGYRLPDEPPDNTFKIQSWMKGR